MVSRHQRPALAFVRRLGPKADMVGRGKSRNDRQRSPEYLGDTQPGSRFTPTCSASSAGPRLAQIQEGEPPCGGALPPGIVKAYSSTKRSIGREGVKIVRGSAWVISGRMVAVTLLSSFLAPVPWDWLPAATSSLVWPLFISIKEKKVFVVVGLWVCGQREALSKPCGKPEGFSIRAAYP